MLLLQLVHLVLVNANCRLRQCKPEKGHNDSWLHCISKSRWMCLEYHRGLLLVTTSIWCHLVRNVKQCNYASNLLLLDL